MAMGFVRPMGRAAAAMGLLALVLLAGCGGPGSADRPGGSGAPDGARGVIRLADVQWQSLWINNAIARFIIEKGYGYPVETVEMTTPIMQQAIVKGDIDVVMEVWTSNVADWYHQALDEGAIVDLGLVMDRASQGWYVPAYVVKGDPDRGIEPLAPDLKSVADLRRYAHLFPDPEEPGKGLLINCITGWECAKVNRIKLHAYGLADLYNVQEPGASAAMDAAIAGAYRQGKPFLTYYWEPTWLVGTFDLIRLEEPPSTPECRAEIERAQRGEIAIEEVSPAAGCAYPEERVVKVSHPGLQDRAPEVVAFLERMTLPTDILNKVAAYMEQEEASAEEAARYFFVNYPEVWRSWVPAEVAEKVEQALE
ncbi:MAG: glycine betaine ABC transporter substrate-binding protein [Bacillota bacterium]